MDQNERDCAGLVGERLGIAIHFQDRSARMIDPDWNVTAVHTPEAVSYPTDLAGGRDTCRSMAGYSRVMFYGEGPDNALSYEWQAYLSYLVRKRNFRCIARGVCAHIIRHRRIPLLPTLPRMLRARTERNRWRL